MVSSVLATAVNTISAMKTAITNVVADDWKIVRQRRSNGGFRMQSAASKKLCLDRATAKRQRKALINHARVLRGEMDYTDAHMERHGIVVLGRSDISLNGRVVGKTRRVVISREDVAMTNNHPEFTDMTVAEILSYGRERGAPVTTKMTKARLIETIRNHF